MKLGKQTKGALTYAQKVGLAMEFIGEHKEQFEEWLRSKNLHTEFEQDDDLIKLRRICEVQKQICIDLMTESAMGSSIYVATKAQINCFDMVILEINKLINENVKKEVKEND